MTCTGVILVTAAAITSAGGDLALGSFASGFSLTAESPLGAAGGAVECLRNKSRMILKERLTAMSVAWRAATNPHESGH